MQNVFFSTYFSLFDLQIINVSHRDEQIVVKIISHETIVGVFYVCSTKFYKIDRTGFLAPWIRLVFLKIFCDDGFLILVGRLVPVSYFFPELD